MNIEHTLRCRFRPLRERSREEVTEIRQGNFSVMGAMFVDEALVKYTTDMFQALDDLDIAQGETHIIRGYN